MSIGASLFKRTSKRPRYTKDIPLQRDRRGNMSTRSISAQIDSRLGAIQKAVIFLSLVL